MRFRPYPEYRDSGVEWLGRIPAGWGTRRLKYSAPLVVERSDQADPELPYVALEHMEPQTGRLNLEAKASVDGEVDVQGASLRFKPGDVLFGKLRPYLAKVVQAAFEGTCSSELLVLRSREGVGPRALSYQLLSAGFIGHINAMTYGTKMPRANPDQISCAAITIAPLAEQQAIASFLDRETARIDALVAKKERLIELLREKRAALITKAVTRGLDPNVPMKDSGVEWLGEIPAHWELKRVRHIVRRVEQGWSPDCENREADQGEWGVLKAGCVNRGVFIESEHKALPAQLEPVPELEIGEGDLLMSRASGSRELVGSVAVVPKCRSRLLLCDKVFRLHVRIEEADKQFVAYAMNSRIARWQIEVVLSGGSGLANNIAQEVVKDLTLVQPPPHEQRAIAAALDRETVRIHALVAKVRDAIERLKELRTALISAAVTGKIDVRGEQA